MNRQLNHWPNILFTWFRYAVAKTASIQFTKMLAIKNPDILCISVHPGLVMNTNLFSYWTRLPFVGIFFWILFQIVGYFFGVSNEQGSISTLKCALSPKLTAEEDNGKYYTTGGYESKPSYVANSLDNAASTWIWTVHELRDRGHEIWLLKLIVFFIDYSSSCNWSVHSFVFKLNIPTKPFESKTLYKASIILSHFC